eukprot:2302-Amphidinium_carterae.1
MTSCTSVLPNVSAPRFHHYDLRSFVQSKLRKAFSALAIIAVCRSRTTPHKRRISAHLPEDLFEGGFWT